MIFGGDDRDAQMLAVIRADGWKIVNALSVYAERMEQNALEMGLHYDAGQANPAVKLAQDNTSIVNSAYRDLVHTFATQGADARQLATMIVWYIMPEAEVVNE